MTFNGVTTNGSKNAHPTCTVVERWVGSTVIVDCTGEVDVTNAAVLERRISSALASKPSAVVVNLSGLGFLAARGMNVLIGASACLRDRVASAVVADGPKTRRPMTLIGLDSEVSMHSTLNAALAAVNAAPPAAAAAGA